MATFLKRCSAMALVIGLFMALSAVISVGAAHADTKYYYQGTGPTENLTPAERGSADRVINMSTDRGWKAEFAPAHGGQTMDESVDDAVAKGYDSVATDLSAGESVTIEGFSLGAVGVDEIAKQLDRRGVDMTNLQIEAIADGRQPGTGALVVLKPYADTLASFGVTTSGPTTTRNGQWTYRCIRYDMVCDMVDPVKNPMGAVTRVAGYLFYHGAGDGKDPTYNYGNLRNLKSTTTKRGNQTIVMYDAPNPLDRFTGKATTAAPVAAPVAMTPALSPAPVYTAPEPAPVYQAPTPVKQQVQQTWRQAAPIIHQVAPQAVKPIKDIASQFGIKLP